MLARVEERLRERIGLDAESIGSGALAAAVRSRMEACAITTIDVYVARLDRAPEEMDALIENVVVNETWFFRDEEPFHELRRAAQTWKSNAWATDTFSVLSVPCASGEEPYSIAMTLLDAGLLSRFFVDAVDVSTRALEIARRGTYGSKSFRTRNASFRKRFFKQRPEGEEVNENVRARVRFARASIVDPNFIKGRGPYDAIFCRNLLIYLDRDSRARAIDALASLLAEKGLLFMGHAEMLESINARFERVGPVGAFAYARKPETPRRSMPDVSEMTPTSFKLSKSRRPTQDKLPVAQPLVTSFPSTEGTSDKTLERAAFLADRGDLAQAAELCRKCLVANPTRVNAHWLLGVISSAEGQEKEAEHHFRRALYLDPKHYESLVHLALLCERAGDVGSAANLRRRAERALQTKGEAT